MMAREIRRMRDERGSAAPLVAALCLLLAFFCAVAVDLSGAFLVRESLANDLAAAKDEASAPQNSIAMKNAEDPGAEIAATLARSLRSNGYQGEIEVWVCEAPASEVPERRRALAWGAQISTSYETYFARAVGVGDIDVATSICASAVPYSSGRAWRPAQTGLGGKYEFAAGSSPEDFSFSKATSESQLPKEVLDRLEETVEEM